MKRVLIVMISLYIWNMGQTNPTVGNKEPFPSKYSAQLLDCGVQGKIQLLQIPETCEDESTEMKRGVLRETNVLSPRKLKKTLRVSCCVSVDESRGYWNKMNKLNKMNKVKKRK